MFCTTDAPTVPGMPDKSFDAFQSKSDAVIDEIIPVAAGFGVHVDDTPIILDRRRLIQAR